MTPKPNKEQRRTWMECREIAVKIDLGQRLGQRLRELTFFFLRKQNILKKN
jgi:hypothetical protein